MKDLPKEAIFGLTLMHEQRLTTQLQAKNRMHEGALVQDAKPL